MLRGYWIKPAAAVLASAALIWGPFVAALLPALEGVNGERTSYAREDSTNEESSPPRFAVSENAVNRPAAPGENAQDNPNPGQGVSDPWARRDAIAQIIMAIASIATVGLLWITIRLTRETLKEAANATKAAQDNIKATERIGYAQTRAYLAVIEPTLIIKNRGNHIVFKVFFRIFNAGQSPALISKTHWKCILSTKDGPRPIAEEDEGTKDTTEEHVIGPHMHTSKRWTFSRKVDAFKSAYADTEGFVPRSAGVTVYVAATYRDYGGNVWDWDATLNSGPLEIIGPEYEIEMSQIGGTEKPSQPNR